MKKFPCYRQLDSADCGPTCLKMIARFYGRNFELHDTDILGCGMEIFGMRKGIFVPKVTASFLSFSDFTEGNPIAHPTVFIRRASFQAKGLHYRSDYIYAEDYKLWVDALQAGLCLDNLATLLLRYRTSPRQNSIKYDLRQKKTTRQIQSQVKRIMEKQQNESYEKA